MTDTQAGLKPRLNCSLATPVARAGVPGLTERVGCARDTGWVPDAPKPIVSLEQLTHLLSLQRESETLDFKVECDLNDRRSCLELAKDVAAMQIHGGHIVIGADNSGRPVPPGVSDTLAPLFDEARLRPKLRKWLPEPLQILTAEHQLDDCRLVVIYVAPSVDGFCIIEKDGAYDDGGSQKLVFRQGEVYARHGTSSERWNQKDIAFVWDRAVNARKETWRAELREGLASLGIARDAQRLMSGPAANYSWRIDQEAFDAATIELFRASDDIPIRLLLDQAPSDAATLLDNGEWGELETLIGRITSLAALALRVQRTPWFESALGALMGVYRLGFEPGASVARRDGKGVDLWLLVLEHVLALGGLAVRTEDWPSTRAIVTRPPVADPHYATWLRHGLTMGARANRLESESLLVRAAERVVDLPALRAGASQDEVLTSVCQFDMLAALTIIDETGSLSTNNWYTNFARYYSTRSEPVVERLLSDETMRQVIFPRDDQLLADALREIDLVASREGVRYNGWWGFRSPEVEDFLSAHPSRG